MERHVPAFREKLVISELEKPYQPIPKLYEFERDKRYIVRKVEDYQLEEGQRTGLDEIQKTLKSLFDEMENTYGIKVPAHFVIAEDENKKNSLYILTDRIASIDLDALDEATKQKVGEGIKTIFSALLQYYEAKVENGEDFLSDLAELGQYIYGTKEGETEAGWYMIDTDPYYTKDRQTLYDALDTLNDELDDLERKFGMDMSAQKKSVEGVMKKLEEELA